MKFNSKINQMFAGMRLRRVFFVYLAVFVLMASIAIKAGYAYLAITLPMSQDIVLVSFSPQKLIDDLKSRLTYLAPRIKGVTFKVHKVKMRENLWKISKRNGYDVHTIIGCNPQLETYQINVNQKLLLPSKAGTLHIIQKDDTFEAISERYDIDADDIKSYNSGISVLKPGEMMFVPKAWPDISLMNDKMREKYELRSLFVSPLGGRLSSTFGMRRHPVTRKHRFHGGIDIAVRNGTWVGAAADGVVTLASSNVGHYGKAVYIKHKNGYVTHYGHLSKIRVKKGQKVKAHNLIAKSGSTGRVTGPHLHFTVIKNKKYIDPLKFLW